MAVTLSSADNALKSVYLGIVANQLNINANPLLAKIKQSSTGIWGKEIIKMAPYGINGGIGAGTETGSLPAVGGNNYVQFKSTLKNLYGKIDISDKAIRASQNNAGAFVNILNDEMEGLVKASAFNLGRMLYGDGTGLLATSTENYTTSSTYFTVDDVRNVIEGMIVDVYAGTSAVLSSKRISYVDRANKRIYLSDATVSSTISTGALFYVQGSKGNEITGLDAIFGSGDLYGLSRTTYPWLTPYTNEGVSMDDVTLQNTIDAVEDKGGNEIDFIACARDTRKAYQQYLTYYKRNIDTIVLEGGSKAITFNGIPVVADRFIASGVAYFLSTKDFVLHQLDDWRWLEDEGGRIITQNGNFPTYTATLVKYADLICDRPVGQAKLTSISSTITNPYTTITTELSGIKTNTATIATNTTP